MSKIICDICGTSYPETSEQCPICGTVRPVDISGVVSDDNYGEEKSGYTYVKGGRFSKANVKKRNMAQATQDNVSYQNSQSQYSQNQYSQAQYSEPEDEEEVEGTNKGLIITAILLFVAIILLAIYIGVQFFGNSSSTNKDEPAIEPTVETTEQLKTEPSTAETTEVLEVPCVSLQMKDNASNMIRLYAVGEYHILEVDVEPADTTDLITYESDDKTIATVDDQGRIEAVAAGETTVWVSCGSESMICYVVCDFEDPTEETTAPTDETEPSEPETNPAYTIDDLKIKTFQNSGEITISINELAKIYVGNIPLEEVKIYAKDPTIVKVEGANVVGLSRGTTIVYVEYGDLKQECLVRVLGNTYAGQTGSGNVDNPESSN